MKKDTILIAIIAVLVGVIGGYAVANYSWHGPMGFNRDFDDMPMGMYGADGRWDEDDVYGHMGHMMGMAVASEKDFLEGMIPHHQEAVDTAKEVIERGGSTPEIKALVEGIVVAQEKEIADMKTWYGAWYGAPYVDNGKYEPMMRELENLSGAALDKAFLEDMIMHHMGAIMMARSVAPYVEHDEIKNLTQAIVTTQSEEILEMRRMLSGL